MAARHQGRRHFTITLYSTITRATWEPVRALCRLVCHWRARVARRPAAAEQNPATRSSHSLSRPSLLPPSLSAQGMTPEMFGAVKAEYEAKKAEGACEAEGSKCN